MRIDVITLFPEFLEQVTRFGIVKRACEQKLVELHTCNPRDFTEDVHKTVDDRPYGGGPGMVMKYPVLRDAILDIKEYNKGPVIYLSPQGRLLDHQALDELSRLPEIVLLSGRYEGVDERVIERFVDQEYSIGDYVLSGGELPAMVMIDAIARLQPGALGDEQSAQQDSFATGLLDHPHYTRPEQVDDMPVPEVLLQGNHEAIAKWRMQQALKRTWARRPELLSQIELTEEQKEIVARLEQNKNESGK
jgi:tRNA (guanine37-N1)-methyltransferase